MLCQLLLYSKVNQLYVYMHPPFGFSSYLGHHRALGRALFYTQHYIYVNHNLQFIPPHPGQYPYVHSLCLCLYFCFANKFICIIFLDSTNKQYYMIFVLLFLTTLLCIPGPLMSLQIAQLHSSLWLSSIPLYICITSSLSILLLMYIQVVSMSWLL